jgi:hypothetical protein
MVGSCSSGKRQKQLGRQENAQVPLIAKGACHVAHTSWLDLRLQILFSDDVCAPPVHEQIAPTA